MVAATVTVTGAGQSSLAPSAGVLLSSPSDPDGELPSVSSVGTLTLVSLPAPSVGSGPAGTVTKRVEVLVDLIVVVGSGVTSATTVAVTSDPS